MNRIVAGNTV